MSHSDTESKSPALRGLLPLLGGSLAILALGVLFAVLWLPEWSAGDIAPASEMLARARALIAQTEIELTQEPLQASLTSRQMEGRLAYQVLGDRAGDWLARARHPFYVEIGGTAFSRNGTVASLSVALGLDGQPWHADWQPVDLASFMPAGILAGQSQDPTPWLSQLLLRPGEQLGEPVQLVIAGNPATAQPILGPDPPQYLSIMGQSPVVKANRRVGSIDDARQHSGMATLKRAGLLLLPILLVSLLVLGLFIHLSLRQRIDFKNAAVLTLPVLAASIAQSLSNPSKGFLFLIQVLVGALGSAISLFLLWSVAESWHRTSRPGLVNNLDWLRRGILGPRSGGALLGGFAAGLAVAGLRLGLPAIASRTSLAWPAGSTIELPAGWFAANALSGSLFLAGIVLLVLALSLRVVPARWAPVTAVVLSAILVQGPFASYWAGVVANLVLISVVVFAHQRWNVTGLLTASVVGSIVPVTLFASLHTSWLGGTLATSAALLAVPLVGALVGLRRPDLGEDSRTVAPAFVRRIEEQRRLGYEMDLLARMQRGLLPATLPHVPGYQIAARSDLATEAGGDLYHFLRDRRERLWIAAGDVAGHGYSCAIAQAMTKAALVSLYNDHDSPAALLLEIDRVLRTGGVDRHFTSLALACLEPRSGELVVSNAGHPYPMHLAKKEVHEIALPSLPLGQGPPRTYRDHELRLGLGDSLILYSDGLYEATSPDGRPYGFDRPMASLARSGPATATEMLEGVLADWRQHLAGSPPVDDTTLVVIKRLRA